MRVRAKTEIKYRGHRARCYVYYHDVNYIIMYMKWRWREGKMPTKEKVSVSLGSRGFASAEESRRRIASGQRSAFCLKARRWLAVALSAQILSQMLVINHSALIERHNENSYERLLLWVRRQLNWLLIPDLIL